MAAAWSDVQRAGTVPGLPGFRTQRLAVLPRTCQRLLSRAHSRRTCRRADHINNTFCRPSSNRISARTIEAVHDAVRLSAAALLAKLAPAAAAPPSSTLVASPAVPHCFCRGSLDTIEASYKPFFYADHEKGAEGTVLGSGAGERKCAAAVATSVSTDAAATTAAAAAAAWRR